MSTNIYNVFVNDKFFCTERATSNADAEFQTEQRIKRLIHINEDYKKYIGQPITARLIDPLKVKFPK